MKPACPNPCNDCPFRKNSLPGWLGDWPSASHLSSYVMANKYPCHSTMPDRAEYEDMGDEPLDDSEIDDLILMDSTQCRGAILYKEKTMNVMYGVGEIGPNHENILDPREFLAHHSH